MSKENDRPIHPTLIREERPSNAVKSEAETLKALAQSKIQAQQKIKQTVEEQVSDEQILEVPDDSQEEVVILNDPPTFSLDQVQQLIDGAISKAIAPLQEQHQKEIDRLQEQISTEQQQHQIETEGLQEQIIATNVAAENKETEYQAQIKQATDTLQKFNDLYKLTGAKTPVQEKKSIGSNVNRLISASADKTSGIIAECLQIKDQAPKILKQTGAGYSYYHADTIELDRFVRKNRAAVMQAMDTWGKQNGFFQGGRRTIIRETATTIPDLPGGFLDVLSALGRTSHHQGYVMYQLINTRLQFDKAMGDTIQIPRSAYQPAPTNPDDRLLSGGGVFSRIVNDGQNLSTGIVSAQLQEWGLGKDVNSAPVELPSFVQSYSMLDLMQLVERNLVHDYYSWEDLKIRSLWTPTSRIVYNNNDRVTTTPGDLGAGSVGTLTRGFLTNLYAEMQGELVPPLPDGCYILVLHTKALAQLQNDFDKYWNPPSPNELQQFVNMFNYSMYEGDSARVSGYQGKHCNFHIFATNAFGLGVPGTEGVQTETLGVGATTTRTNYAAGGDSIGRGVGTPMEIRRDTNDDFQRLGRYIWRSEEGFVAMDVDSTGYSDTSAVPQQLRVFQVRTTDVEL